MIRVAVIDDHAVVRMGLKYAISLESDMEFAGELTDGEGAAAFVVTEKPDVVLLDVRMPKVDGIAALESILAVKPSAKIVMLTTSEADDDIYRAIKLGAKGYVVKDRDSDSILKAIRQVASGGKYFPDEVMKLFHERAMTPDLTAREREVLEMMAKGLSNQEIGEALSISPESVKIHLKHIFEKLGVSNRVECALEAKRRGFLKEDA
jgi:DNA-binding NarL/FixJ family response regulator